MAAHPARPSLQGLVCSLMIALCAFTHTPSAAGCEDDPLGTASRRLMQIDFSQRSGIPRSNPSTTGGSSNTANAFSSVPGEFRRIGALGFSSSVTPSRSISAADTTVVSGVRGTDNMASGSGFGRGSGSGTIGSNRGYTSAGGRKLKQDALTTTGDTLKAADALAGRQNLVADAILQATNSPFFSTTLAQAIAAQGTGRRALLQRSSVGAQQGARAGTSTSLLGADPSAGTQARADLDTQIYGTGSGSVGNVDSLNSANFP